MFQIYDGREHFYQWDRDRKLIVMDGSIKEVHFCNRTEECSLRREVYKEGELHLVEVPNILFQESYKINVYGYDGNYTKQSETFTVQARSKPADYIYTEEELKEWEELEKRIKALEENGGNANVDLAGYATEEFVNSAVAENAVIKALPIKEKQVRATNVNYYVDLEELESLAPYGLGAIPEEEKNKSGLICYCIYCEDGTRNIVTMQQKNAIVSLVRTDDTAYSLRPLAPAGINLEFIIDVSDKSTANNVVVTAIENRDFISTTNREEYIPTEDYHPTTKKYVDDAVGALTIIKPLPIRDKNITASMAQYYVDIEQLENGCCYGLPTMPEEEKRNTTYVRYSVFCEDGTIKNCILSMPNYVYSVAKVGNVISLVGVLPAGLNTEYKVNISDKSTASKITVETIRNRDFLGINNTAEFIPTNNYQPATKKYVDDTVSANAGGASGGSYQLIHDYTFDGSKAENKFDIEGYNKIRWEVILGTTGADAATSSLIVRVNEYNAATDKISSVAYTNFSSAITANMTQPKEAAGKAEKVDGFTEFMAVGALNAIPTNGTLANHMTQSQRYVYRYLPDYTFSQLAVVCSPSTIPFPAGTTVKVWGI